MNPHSSPQAYKHELFFQIKPHRRNLNSSYSTQSIPVTSINSPAVPKIHKNAQNFRSQKVIAKLHKGYTNKGGTSDLHLKSCAQPAQA
jgi:hypothetical protein